MPAQAQREPEERQREDSSHLFAGMLRCEVCRRAGRGEQGAALLGSTGKDRKGVHYPDYGCRQQLEAERRPLEAQAISLDRELASATPDALSSSRELEAAAAAIVEVLATR